MMCAGARHMVGRGAARPEADDGGAATLTGGADEGDAAATRG